MNDFDASERWGVKKDITALTDPIAEFNARGGFDFNEYRALENHIDEQHKNTGDIEWKRIKAELPPFETFEDPETGQRIRAQRFNWPEDGDVSEKSVTFWGMSFTVSLEPEHVQYENFLIAKQLGEPFVVFETPAYGKSDKLTKGQRAELRQDGDFGAIAEPMLRIAKSFGTKRAKFAGYSMGGATAAAMAARADKYGITVESLFVMEDPQIVEHPTMQLIRDFTSDVDNLKFTWQHPADPVMRKLGKMGIPPYPHGLLSYGKAMTKGGLERDIMDTVTKNPNVNLTLAGANRSKINPNPANAELYNILRETFPDLSLRRIIIPGEGHAFSDSGYRLASVVKLALAA